MNDSVSTNPGVISRQTVEKLKYMRVLMAASGALVINQLLLLIGSAAGASLVVAAPEQISAEMVAIATVTPLLLIGGIVWFLEKRWSIRRLAAWAGLAFALVTIAGSILASADTITTLTLSAMHIVVGMAWFYAMEPWK